LFNFFICSKASNPCDLVDEWPGGHKSVYHCLNSLHHQLPPIASKRRLRVRQVDSKESKPFPLNSYLKVICMVYSKQIPASNILILIDLLITV